MTNLPALLEKLERLEGPNFQLECEIHALLPEPKTVVPPNYTYSVDAALKLVPSGWDWFADHVEGRTVWTIAERAGVREGLIGRSEAGPAIALCIAALKARNQ